MHGWENSGDAQAPSPLLAGAHPGILSPTLQSGGDNASKVSILREESIGLTENNSSILLELANLPLLELQLQQPTAVVEGNPGA